MSLLHQLKSPVLLRGNDKKAFRDPTAFWKDGKIHLFFTLVENDACDLPWLTVAHTATSDFVHWSPIQRLTPYDRSLNFSSPGNIVKDGEEYVLCLQTYCRENGEKYGNARSRIYAMRSADLESWSQPELLSVKGDLVPEEKMGRMIDPFLLRANEEWWCFFKQSGISYSRSPDLRHWTFCGRTGGGENPCIIPWEQGYLMFHSPQNGIGVKFSEDLVNWRDVQPSIYLNQPNWPWATGRLTAAYVLDARSISGLECYIMFFHGSGPEDEETCFDKNASIGIAWSKDLQTWEWPEERN